MDWTGINVLVTGAGGFIGSHLTERLVRQGARVRAFIRYNSAGQYGLLHDLPAELFDQIEFFTGDLCSAEACRQTVQGCDYVFHLGALIAIPYSYRDPRVYFETNVMGTLNIAEACRQNGTTRLIHTSTSEVYGTAQTDTIDENHPLQGQSPYAASKIGADKLLESYYRSFDLPVAILRPFNTFGPRQSARAVIPTIISQALKGTYIKLGALHPQRDFTYVEDTASGFVAMAEANAGHVLGKVTNLGTGKTISIGDLIVMIGDIMGKELEVSADDQRVRPEKSEVNRLISNNSKAQTRLNWTPQHSLREGLQKTIAWVDAHADHYLAERYTI